MRLSRLWIICGGKDGMINRLFDRFCPCLTHRSMRKAGKFMKNVREMEKKIKDKGDFIDD